MIVATVSIKRLLQKVTWPSKRKGHGMAVVVRRMGATVDEGKESLGTIENGTEGWRRRRRGF